MKMHSPGHTSAALITSCDVAGAGTQARLPELPGSLSDLAVLDHVRDAVLELHEHVVAVVDAEAVAGAEVLVDPDTHGGGQPTAYHCRTCQSPSPKHSPAHAWNRADR